MALLRNVPLLAGFDELFRPAIVLGDALLKFMCRVGVSCVRPNRLHGTLDEQQSGGLADPLLGGSEAHQLPVEFRQDLRDAR